MNRPNLYDYLKILALVTMIVDHVWFLFYPDMEILRVIGRFAFPVFLFLVWYNHSYRFQSRLWIRGVILQIWLWLAARQGYIDLWYANILLGIWATRVLLSRVQRQRQLALELLLFALALVYASQSQYIVDFGTLLIVFGLLWYQARTYRAKILMYLAIVWSVVYHILFMQEMYWFGETMLIPLMVVWWLLCISLIWLTRSNTSLTTPSTKINFFLVRVSRHSLELYVMQAAILGVMYIV